MTDRTDLPPPAEDSPRTDGHPLDNPAWLSLTGHHARVAEINGNAARYQSDVSPFAGLSDPSDPRSWIDLAELIGPAAVAPVSGIAAAARCHRARTEAGTYLSVAAVRSARSLVSRSARSTDGTSLLNRVFKT